jgi:iron complex outermembrane recepter protein
MISALHLFNFKTRTMKQITFLFAMNFFFIFTNLQSQIIVKLNISDENNYPLSGVQLRINKTSVLETSDLMGQISYKLSEPSIILLELYHPDYSKLSFTATISNDTTLYLIMDEHNIAFNTVEVIGSWLQKDHPMTYYQMNKQELNRNNNGQDVPYIVQWTPSVVATSDGGTGIGYTGMSIRGSDPTRVNISINGVPINDSESQGVFWVNMPDFSSSVDAIQIQRGVGSSTNGSVAFGATVNLSTQKLDPKFNASISTGIGSFNTQRLSAQLNSGLINKKYIFEGRVSSIQSDGYVDRASADLRSWFFKSAYLGKKSALKLIVFSGAEKTYQAWNGLPYQYAQIPELRTYNSAGAISTGNFYNNEVDDYKQTHFHLIHQYDFLNNWSSNITLHYTRGYGFFEQYRENDRLSNYNILPFEIGEQIISRSDLIRRRWLDNHFGGYILNLDYTPNDNRNRLNFGLSQNLYLGDHFGRIIWMRLAGPNEYDQEYYFNEGRKSELSSFIKYTYQLNSFFSYFFDVQYRNISYAYLGNNNAGISFDDAAKFSFVNPKTGIHYQNSKGHEMYLSFSTGSREPNRSDFTNSTETSKPKPEYLYNSELGYRKSYKKSRIGINHYFMYYIDQLALTGRINDVGAYTRVNVPKSYRTGIELDALADFDFIFVGSALTVSQNKIVQFDEYIDSWDSGSQDMIRHQNTDLSLSPNIIANLQLGFRVPKIKIRTWAFDPEIMYLWKYVGSQFLDNTSNQYSKLDPYSFSDLRFIIPVYQGNKKRLEFKFWVNNLLDQKFVNNGWIYRFISSDYDPRNDDPYSRLEQNSTYNLTGYFPQAGRNWILGLEFFF